MEATPWIPTRSTQAVNPAACASESRQIDRESITRLLAMLISIENIHQIELRCFVSARNLSIVFIYWTVVKQAGSTRRSSKR